MGKGPPFIFCALPSQGCPSGPPHSALPPPHQLQGGLQLALVQGKDPLFGPQDEMQLCQGRGEGRERWYRCSPFWHFGDGPTEPPRVERRRLVDSRASRDESDRLNPVWLPSPPWGDGPNADLTATPLPLVFGGVQVVAEVMCKGHSLNTFLKSFLS